MATQINQTILDNFVAYMQYNTVEKACNVIDLLEYGDSTAYTELMNMMSGITCIWALMNYNVDDECMTDEQICYLWKQVSGYTARCSGFTT